MKKDHARIHAVPTARIQAHDALALAAITTKQHYDRRHITKFHQVGDKVLLRLHKGCRIPDIVARESSY